jgi:pyruvate dehydrogenase E2 component (dihydrolipoyllysine-residue acetyltransferase)
VLGEGDRQAIDTRPLLAAVDAPVTVVWGASDRVLPVPDGVELARVEAGRMPHMEASSEVLTAVRSHL